MVMQTLQIRLTQGLIDEISKLVTRGIYPSNSECVRDAVRRLITGSGKIEVPEKEVKEVQEKVAKEVEKQIKQFYSKRDRLSKMNVRYTISQISREA